MELHVSGKLKTATAKQPSFTDFRIEAVFDQKRASTPSEITALSDDAGNFTLLFPERLRTASKTVKFTVSSPAGRIIREMEVMTADLRETITIEVEAFDAGPFDEPPTKVNTPESVAVDALFRTDAALRRAITENLKSLRGESEAVAARVEKAWTLRPSRLSDEELAKRHYVAPGSDPAEVLDRVIRSGVDALRSAKTERALTLRNTAELRKLIKNNQGPGDSLNGVVELGPLIEFIQRQGTGPIRGAELTSRPYTADAEAEAILNAIANGDGDKEGAPVARQQALTSDALEAEELVKDKVNTQMKSATAPESQVTYAYAKLPNSADEDEAQQTILQSFELRKGPTDVTSYHDFHTLQIAFQHVWTEIFDGQLASLGRDLYSEYVKLKDFSGSTQPDLQVGTLADLRRLMEEVKKLSQIVEEKIPPDLKDGGDESKDKGSGGTDKTLEDVGRGLLGAATLGLSEVAIAIFDAFKNKLQEINWGSFTQTLPGGRQHTISVETRSGVAPQNYVKIVLKTDPGSWKKRIIFQEFFNGAFRNHTTISNYDQDSMILPSNLIRNGLLQFDSQGNANFGEAVTEGYGRYVLNNLGERIEDRMEVTFYWQGVN